MFAVKNIESNDAEYIRNKMIDMCKNKTVQEILQYIKQLRQLDEKFITDIEDTWSKHIKNTTDIAILASRFTTASLGMPKTVAYIMDEKLLFGCWIDAYFPDYTELQKLRAVYNGESSKKVGDIMFLKDVCFLYGMRFDDVVHDDLVQIDFSCAIRLIDTISTVELYKNNRANFASYPDDVDVETYHGPLNIHEGDKTTTILSSMEELVVCMQSRLPPFMSHKRAESAKLLIRLITCVGYILENESLLIHDLFLFYDRLSMFERRLSCRTRIGAITFMCYFVHSHLKIAHDDLMQRLNVPVLE